VEVNTHAGAPAIPLVGSSYLGFLGFVSAIENVRLAGTGGRVDVMWSVEVWRRKLEVCSGERLGWALLVEGVCVNGPACGGR
jgi:hypothetical protein